MTTFTIDTDNNITAHAGTPADAPQTESFSTEKQLTKLAAVWPTNRLVEIWNSFAGVTPFDDLKPVKKFTDRNAGVRRIWAAIQRLSPTPIAELADTAPKAAHVAPKNRKAKNSAVPATDAPVGREGSKKAEVLALMRRSEGATLNEIMTVTGWQAHTVRGFVAGALKKAGIAVESTRREDRERVYRIA